MVTQTHPTRDIGQVPHPGPVLAGVDGSRRSRTAAHWAAIEAQDQSRTLELVAACPLPTGLAAGNMAYPLREVEDFTRDDLAQVAQQLSTTGTDVRVSVTSGGPVALLLDAVIREHASLLVVGKRGQGALRRTLVGSTSIAVAGRCPVPVVVVPDQWQPPRLTSAPVLVAVEPGVADAAVLDFAFDRASRLRVPLVAVTVAWTWTPEDDVFPEAWRLHWESSMDRLLAPWHSRHPDVEVALRVAVDDAASAVLVAAVHAQLVVLGRHARQHQQLGFRLGSTTREVLHHSTCPVAVVPINQGRP